ncbi:hypothetical protein MKX03_004977 [Papaver bracteatum]|nr:hypothetical protein MKX03_004977 [Papaver bracteatum]
MEEANADRDHAAGKFLRKREGNEGGDLEKEKNGHGEEVVEGGSASSCKYIWLERRVYPKKFMRKFRLPDNTNVSAISAKCENGVLTVMVEKKLPP